MCIIAFINYKYVREEFYEKNSFFENCLFGAGVLYGVCADT